MPDPHPIAPVWSRLCRVLIGIGSVAWLVLTAAWELATAALGIRPSFLVPRHLGHVIGEQYQSGRDGWTGAEIVDAEIDVEP